MFGGGGVGRDQACGRCSRVGSGGVSFVGGGYGVWGVCRREPGMGKMEQGGLRWGCCVCADVCVCVGGGGVGGGRGAGKGRACW